MRALGPEQARQLRAKVQALEAHERQPARVLLSHGHARYPWFHRLVTSHRILDAVEDLIGPDILVWSVAAFVKEPGSEAHVGWHQDANYWGLRPFDGVVTAWVALSDVEESSGPLEFLRASHLGDLRPRQEMALSRPVDHHSVERATMQAGEFSLHHVKTAHGSQPNRGADRRIGLAIRYMSTCTTSDRAEESAMLVRGKDHFGHFRLERPPAAEDDPTAKLQWQRGVASKSRNIMRLTDKANPSLWGSRLSALRA